MPVGSEINAAMIRAQNEPRVRLQKIENAQFAPKKLLCAKL